MATVIDLALTRTQIMDTAIEKFVYFYGSLVAEDFMESSVLAPKNTATGGGGRGLLWSSIWTRY